MEKSFMFMILAIVAGILVTIQGPLNVELGKSLGSDYISTFITFIVGGIFILLFSIITKQGFPSFELLKSIPWWQYLGGILGAIYVLSVITVIPKLGVGSATVLLMFSQLIASMIIDHFGFFGYPQKPFDLYKFIGVLLMGSGIYLINKK